MPERRRPRTAAEPTVADVLAALDRIAPLRLAADWDNVGLLAGRPEWPASRWLVALDLTDAVAREALEAGVNGLLLYHPPIFKGLRSVTPNCDAPTALLPDLLAARIALLATHTALDAAPGGTNDLLLDAFDIIERRPLTPLTRDGRAHKLAVFVPAGEVAQLRTALADAGAGRIGAYTECSFELAGRGTFLGDASTNPAVGRRGRLETVDEIRLEMVVPTARLGDVVRALYANHSYEEPAFDLYPLREVDGRGEVGAGRVGRLRPAAPGPALLKRLAAIVDMSRAAVVGEIGREFTLVAAAAGSFGVDALREPDTLYLTGEFKHHDALALLKRGVTAVALGHAASEQPVRQYLCQRIRRELPGLDITIASADRDPLQPTGVAPTKEPAARPVTGQRGIRRSTKR